jgi:hypothetical protein
MKCMKDITFAHVQALSMLVVSLFSVCAGGSLGPEAPLLTLCASLVGFIYKEIIVTEKKMLRQFSLMGMGAGLAAFFGASMGGTSTCFVRTSHLVHVISDCKHRHTRMHEACPSLGYRFPH